MSFQITFLIIHVNKISQCMVVIANKLECVSFYYIETDKTYCFMHSQKIVLINVKPVINNGLTHMKTLSSL